MLNPSRFFSVLGALLFSLITAQAAIAAYADPPGRVAHLSDARGEVSYSPAGEGEWFGVVRNRPLIRGDRLWTDRDARAEFQVSSAAVRLGSDTSVEILDLRDNMAQIRMTQGTLNLSVRRMYPGQAFEVATPTLVFTISDAGRYRIDVDPSNAATTIVVWEGAGEANGDKSSFRLRAGDTVRFYDANLRDNEIYGLAREDDFDRYCVDRDHRLDRSASLRYLDDDLVGYADLDEAGSWRPVSSYGNVWFPSRVDANWVPYRDGHWVWQEPWGWTWVDDAPWGFAPSHYGRWVNVSERWGWVPGPRNNRPVYAPALVAFVGGSGWSAPVSLGGASPIGWFPLGPREVYVPSYQASRDYFKRVNVTNTVINTTVITNVYNNYSSGTINVNQEHYANRRVFGAVTVVPRAVFINAQPVRAAVLHVDPKAVSTSQITRLAPIAPSARSVIGLGKASDAHPPREVFDRTVFVRNAPPPVERPFAAREKQLQEHPERAPEPSAIKSVQGPEDNTARKVRVVGERGAVDARAAGSSRGPGKPDTPAATPGQFRPLDRSVQPANEPAPVAGDRGRGKEIKGQGDAQQQKLAVERQAVEKQAAEKQQADDKRQAERQKQQQEQLQRKAASDKQANEKQAAEKQAMDKQAAEKQQADDKRQAERQKQQQEQLQLQRKAASDKQASEKQAVEKQAMDKQVAEKQQAEGKRQAEQQKQQQEQLQRKAASDKQAAEKQAAEKQSAERNKRRALTQQDRQAECVRQAVAQKQDPSQCQIELPPTGQPGNPNRDKNGK